MADRLERPAIQRARRANLYDYLLDCHPNQVVREGDSLRLLSNHSVSIKTGYSGYTDFATRDTGNAIECLMYFLDYSFRDAVAALAVFDGMPEEDLGVPEGNLGIQLHGLPKATGSGPGPQGISVPLETQRSPQAPPPAPKPFAPPEPVRGPYRQLFAYLTQQRGIPARLVQELINRKLLYQEAGHNNMVFINSVRTYAELRGTVSGAPFHGMVSGSALEDFWWFKPGPPASLVSAAYICEGAIDAISLYLLRQRFPLPAGDNPMYCSIGGVANQQRIDSIKAAMSAAGRQTILAVDNDEAGEKCRQRNPDCFSYVPKSKDWNADLLDNNRQSVSGLNT